MKLEDYREPYKICKSVLVSYLSS